MTYGRHKKRKKTLSNMTGKQKIKHRNVTLKFMSITGMMRSMNKTQRILKLKRENVESENKENHPNQREEEIEKNEGIITLEL